MAVLARSPHGGDAMARTWLSGEKVVIGRLALVWSYITSGTPPMCDCGEKGVLKVRPNDASWPTHSGEHAAMEGWSWPNFLGQRGALLTCEYVAVVHA
jgi:hypothetical protein